jgi:serine/threonine protein phosphatase PrpC
MVRGNNEDAFSVSQPSLGKGQTLQDTPFIDEEQSISMTAAFDRLFVTVADGMGGANAGEIASQLAAETINATLLTANPATPIKTLLFQAIDEANQKIIQYGNTNPLSAGMGTTCITAAIDGNKVHLAWIGDSRAYLFSPTNGLSLLSKDHSLVQELVDMQQLDVEAAFYHPDSNIITQSLGDPERVLDPGFLTSDLQVEDLLILCSDGLNSMLRDSEISEIIDNSYHLTATEIAAHLISAANEEGGQDNTTIAVYQRFTEVEPIESTLQIPWTNPKSGAVSDTSKEHSKNARKWLRILPYLLLLGIIGFFVWQHLEETRIAEAQKLIAQIKKDSIRNDSVSREERRVLAEKDSIAKSALDTLPLDSYFDTPSDFEPPADNIAKAVPQQAVTPVVRPLSVGVLVQITQNSKKERALDLVKELKKAKMEASCACEKAPFRVFIKMKNSAELDTLKSVFPTKFKTLQTDFQLKPNEFTIIQK